MASPSPFRKPGHHSTTYTLAPPPPPPNWSQTPTPVTMPYPYSYPQPAQTMPHHQPGSQGHPRNSPQGPRRGSNASSIPPPKPLGLPENRDFFNPPTIVSSGKGGKAGSGRVTPQNDPHRRGMYIPGSSPERTQDEDAGSESGEEYGLEDDPWGPDRPSSRPGSRQQSSGIMGAVAGIFPRSPGRQGLQGMQGGGRMTDAEIEEEARRAREESRREAERILAMERSGGRHPSQVCTLCFDGVGM